MRLEEVPDGIGAVGQVGGRVVAVYREGDEINVMEAACPHAACLVEWSDDEDAWFCPCHGSLFEPNGELARGPAQKPLTALSSRIEDGEIRLVGDS